MHQLWVFEHFYMDYLLVVTRYFIMLMQSFVCKGQLHQPCLNRI